MDETPLTELHRHLDGSLRATTVQMLAAEMGIHVPEDIYFYPGMGLGEALSKFSFTLALLQTATSLARVASELCEDARGEGIEHLEIRFAPQLHGRKGLSMDQVIDAVLDGFDMPGGVILCGLYGDAPALLTELVDLAATRPRVIGIDLAGGPTSSHRWGLADYCEPFARARRHGLGRTVHAGEGRPAAEIKFAIEHLNAQRIGHGLSLADDAELVDLVIARGVTIEACPTSNWHTGVIESLSAHPIKHWLGLGVAVAICTDNTLFSNVDLPTELRRTSQATGLSDDELNVIHEAAHQARFIS